MRTPPRKLGPGEKIRVMVVDDSVVIRRLVTHALEQEPRIEVVGAASNGKLGLERIPQWKPDLVTLDIEMPEMGGIAMLRQIRLTYPAMLVVMFSALTERGAAATLEALAAGADDYVTKVASGGSLDQSMGRFSGDLIPKILQFFQAPSVAASTPIPVKARRIDPHFAPRAMTIGVSTGGPAALAQLMPCIPAGFPLPILIVQHMPPMFTRLLAERLNAISPLQVLEAEHGMGLEPGKVFIAAGGYHMRVSASAAGGSKAVRISLDQEPPVNSCRPSVDVLWQSMADVFGGAVLAVILTGMGQDGFQGASTLSALGARIFAQDESTSVVWGMPGAVVKAGLADRVAALAALPAEILSCVHSPAGIGAL
jgi:two-component system chemotaxis response regulator CheB